jgi:uncharacterized repeat protein (TIGR04076 family)
MPYKVKATVIDIMGDQEKFPCHFLHKIGDEAIFDGESWTGRLCPDLWPGVTEKGAMLFHAGPRYTPHMTYSIVGIHGNKQCEPSNKIYDGRGFKSAFEPYDLPKYHMAQLSGGGRKWPPPKQRIARPVRVMCPDLKTAVVMELEAIDLATGGFALPYYRRQMVIMDRVFKKQGIEADKILNEFSKHEIEDIFPPLSPGGVDRLVEELELTGHMELKDGKAYVTKRGEAKVQDFKKSLTAAEREALKV